ncbi:TAXI family TRAP transporter solute-binding subunit [Bradyrhizobium sp.]|uniref:TAXI family TRAP transporter solute-binding subunit n=1 Tax=Bradyrhizobium sp. TaxID=376 RepID=UPI001EBC7F20|nr:TAXI family TRAP transporter solute-binding subunit [Bradyrhizobium sp.]MBV8922603.1 ABC transporter substrate-binding protein [Bradyrhizobium sp.]MBV9983831.1 ABC transporter substrate-binding protein [Bradyrhizobium sp.]
MVTQPTKAAFPHFRPGAARSGIPRRAVHALVLGLLFATMLLLSRAPGYAQTTRATKAGPTPLAEEWKTKINSNTVAIIAGSPEDTYLDITHDLAVVLNDDNLRILPIVGQGGAQNIRDVLYLRGVDIGITTAQMLRYFASTGELSRSLDQQLTYITRLYPEEMHVVAARDIKSIQDLNGKKVNFAEAKSSTEITARDVFGLLSINVDEVNMNEADAIAAIKSGQIAATVMISGKPAEVISRIGANDNLHLLEVPYTPALENIYSRGELEPQLYPNLIDGGKNLQTVAVDAVMITINWQPATDRYRRVAKFVEALFSKFPELQKSPRHPKWREVDLSKDLPGWDRFPVAQYWLQQDKFAEFVAKRQVGDASNPADKQRLFKEFLEWTQNEAKKR